MIECPQTPTCHFLLFVLQKWAVSTGALSFAWAKPGQTPHIDILFAFLDGPHGSLGRYLQLLCLTSLLLGLHEVSG